MRNALAIARKELSIYFTTPLAYGVITGMVLASAFWFMRLLQEFVQMQEIARAYTWARMPPDYAIYKNLTDGVVIQLWGFLLFLTLLAPPLLSMGLFAKEKRERTFELLMTTPLRPWELVIGKYLGGLGVTAVTLGSTILFPLILAAFGSSESGQALEWQTVSLGFLGLMLLGGLGVAVTMLVSAFTQTELLAAFIGVVVMLVWFLLRGAAQSAEDPLRSIIGYIALDGHLQSMMRGVLELKGLVMFGTSIAFLLFLTHRKIESERWA
jgi:ABC-2 type transport system permease protein